jgi:hypothetical protein
MVALAVELVDTIATRLEMSARHASDDVTDRRDREILVTRATQPKRGRDTVHE